MARWRGCDGKRAVWSVRVLKIIPVFWWGVLCRVGECWRDCHGLRLAMTLRHHHHPRSIPRISRVGFYLPASCGGAVAWAWVRDCHGQSPRNDAEIATSRADSRNDVAGILLPTRIVVGLGGVGVGERLPRFTPRNDDAGILLYTRIVVGCDGWARVGKNLPASWESVFLGGLGVCGYGKGAVITKKVPDWGLFKYILGVSL